MLLARLMTPSREGSMVSVNVRRFQARLASQARRVAFRALAARMLDALTLRFSGLSARWETIAVIGGVMSISAAKWEAWRALAPASRERAGVRGAYCYASGANTRHDTQRAT